MKNGKIPGLLKFVFDQETICAYYFAAAAHAAVKQKRNYSDEPYIVHPVGVLEILLETCTTRVSPVMAQATLLHDTTEDTGVTEGLIRQLFGAEVSNIVKFLSKATTPSFGNRSQRHAVEIQRLSGAPAIVQNIKAADIIHNRRTIVIHDPSFLVTFDIEANQLFEAMKLVDDNLKDLWYAETHPT